MPEPTWLSLCLFKCLHLFVNSDREFNIFPGSLHSAIFSFSFKHSIQGFSFPLCEGALFMILHSTPGSLPCFSFSSHTYFASVVASLYFLSLNDSLCCDILCFTGCWVAPTYILLSFVVGDFTTASYTTSVCKHFPCTGQIWDLQLQVGSFLFLFCSFPNNLLLWLLII